MRLSVNMGGIEIELMLPAWAHEAVLALLAVQDTRAYRVRLIELWPCG